MLDDVVYLQANLCGMHFAVWCAVCQFGSCGLRGSLRVISGVMQLWRCLQYPKAGSQAASLQFLPERSISQIAIPVIFNA